VPTKLVLGVSALLKASSARARGRARSISRPRRPTPVDLIVLDGWSVPTSTGGTLTVQRTA
jgi:hypothetical protein